MGRITIKDLPEEHKIGAEEMRKVFGGNNPIPLPYPNLNYFPPHNASLGSGLFSFGYSPNPIRFRGTLPTPIP